MKMFTMPSFVDTQESPSPSLFPWLSAGIQAFLLILLTTNMSYCSMRDIIIDTGRQDLILIYFSCNNQQEENPTWWNVLSEMYYHTKSTIEHVASIVWSILLSDPELFHQLVAMFCSQTWKTIYCRIPLPILALNRRYLLEATLCVI